MNFITFYELRSLILLEYPSDFANLKRDRMASKKTNPNKTAENDSNSRRDFIKKSGLFTALAFTPPSLVMASENKWDEKIAEYLETVPLSIEVNGKKHNLYQPTAEHKAIEPTQRQTCSEKHAQNRK